MTDEFTEREFLEGLRPEDRDLDADLAPADRCTRCGCALAAMNGVMVCTVFDCAARGLDAALVAEHGVPTRTTT